MQNGTGVGVPRGTEVERVVRALGAVVVMLLWAALIGQALRGEVALPTPRPEPLAAASGLQFEPNLGQAPRGVRFVGRAAGQRISVFDDGLALAVDAPGGAQAYLRLIGAAAGAAPQPQAPLAARTHLLTPSVPGGRLTDVPRYAQLRQREVWPGIDLVYYGRDAALEFDLVVHPGADPGRIRLQVGGTHPPALDASGNLQLDGPQGRLRLHRPVFVQNIDGRRRELEGGFTLGADGALGFTLPDYDRSRPLVIDPVFRLLASTYLGGVHDDQVGAMAVDAQGNAYVIGNSGSEDWPVSANALQDTRLALGRYVRNVVVTKFDAGGNLLWSTFLGGTTNDYGRAIALAPDGTVWVAGYTESADFPTTDGAYQRSFAGSQSAWLAQLSADGSALVRSTLYGGSGGASAVSLVRERAGTLLLGGTAGPGLPTTAGAYQRSSTSDHAAFVARFDPAATGAAQLLAATYFGAASAEPNSLGTGNFAHAMALAPSGEPWIAGQAFTRQLPLTAGSFGAAPAAMTPSCNPGSVPLNSFAYAATLSADLSALRWSGYLSGGRGGPATCSEYAWALAFDAGGNVFVAGSTASRAFPTTPGALQPSSPAPAGFDGYAGFVTKLTSDGSAVLWSTYLGGAGGATFMGALAVDGAGSLWVGTTSGGGNGFPVSGDALQTTPGGGLDAAVTRLDGGTGALQYGSYLGGAGNDGLAALAVDRDGGLRLAGTTASVNFPVSANALQPRLTPGAFDGSDWFVTVLGQASVSRVVPASAGNAGDVTLRVDGAGFVEGAVCSLVGAGSSIVASSSAVGAGGGSIGCSFALAGATPGPRDLVVTNPDGTSVTRSGGFTVASGSGPDVSVQVIGRSAVRVGVPSAFGVVVANDGDADAYGILLFVRYSRGLAPVDAARIDPFDLALGRVSSNVAGDPNDYNALPLVQGPDPVTGLSSVPLFVPFLGAGAHLELNFRLVAGQETEGETVEAEVLDPMGATAAEVAAAVSRLSRVQAQRVRAQGLSRECLDAIGNWAAQKLAEKFPGVDCAAKFGEAWRQFIPTANAAAHHIQAPSTVYSMQQLAGAALQSVAACAELAAVEVAAIVKTIDQLLSLMQDAEELAKISEKCRDKDKDKKKGKKKSAKKTTPKKSNDPNDKSGPDGDGSAAHFVATPRVLAYRIGFENKAEATLPAADVVVTDALDTSVFDLDTLALGSITWGTRRIDVPAGLKSHAATVAVDATMSLRVAASLDPATGVLRWTFTTLDPGTRLPPSDPTLGFLPPNRDGTQGQGYVSFTIAPRAGLPDATRWRNAASIVFDANPPIATPAWDVTLDATAPSSRVTSATARGDGRGIDVAWSGSDAGSGVAGYSVFVAEDDGAFTPWLTDTRATGATYPALAGHRYAFYARAIDAAGNVEPDKAAAEASASADGSAAGGGGGGGCTVGPAGQADAALPMLLLAALALRLRRRALTASGSRPPGSR